MERARQGQLRHGHPLRRHPAAARRAVAHRSGQALVEFALLLPVLILVFCGVLDFGRVFYVRTAIANAAREGARYGINHPELTGAQLQSGADARARQELGSVPGIELGAVSTAASRASTAPGSDVTVSVTYTGFTLITQVLVPPLPQSLTFSASATMRVLVGEAP